LERTEKGITNVRNADNRAIGGRGGRLKKRIMQRSDIEEHLKNKLVELVEEHFPKGEPDRGRATVMMSLFYVEMIKVIGTLEDLWQTKSRKVQ
jgi:hypothetical protein